MRSGLIFGISIEFSKKIILSYIWQFGYICFLKKDHCFVDMIYLKKNVVFIRKREEVWNYYI